ncbi:hypothetical protein DYB37_014014 [Aphanomyces astaci]|uniref:Uncharacterized protein n=1 Tax=Aphanomyces astaci TaxID=112090 RepID=A0A3L6VWX2_APHAT|nr:hypothetical protein DYB35_013922 [Aphanomyces astaci]RHZ13023.1 hypothetical protein DYB37_014014 [Aphanomyces astaci]RHZ22390.1 hypothetical protein DYB26_009998 [Aphanomyces astaci]RLO13174.1 hypothetical protein DYB28_001451 [Aphanomyces astaci]
MVRSATGRELTDDERTALYHRLLQLKKNGRVSSGDIKELMRTFHVSQQTISHILLRGCQMAAETGCAKVASRKKGRCVKAFKLEGDNVYKLPHLKKDVQLKSGTVALSPPCDEDVTLALDALESRLDDEHLVDEIVRILGPALNIVDDV